MKIGGGGEHCDIVVVVVVVVNDRLVVVLLGLGGRLITQGDALALGGALEILRSPVVAWWTWSLTCWWELLVFILSKIIASSKAMIIDHRVS